MFSLSPIYSARKSSNHILSKTHKISPDTNLQKTYTNIKYKIVEKLVPSVKKKHVWLGHAGIVDHSVDLSIPDFKKSIKKEWTEAIKISKNYINA